jgi:hypothetical protein
MRQIRQIFGEAPEPDEPQLHDRRRIRLQIAEKTLPKTKFDPKNPKVSVDGVRIALGGFENFVGLMV